MREPLVRTDWQSCFDLEQQGNAGSLAGVPDHMEQVETEYQRVAAALDTVLKEE